MDAERRYRVTFAFWRWAHENRVTGTELAHVTGYAPTTVNRVRLNPRLTVSQRFVDRVRENYQLPECIAFFQPIGVTDLVRSA